MPTFDFKCKTCKFEAEISLMFSENEEVNKKGGIDCPQCENLMTKQMNFMSFKFADTRNKRGKLQPGSKKGLRKMMQGRFKKREKRLEEMSPGVKKRMRRFMDKYNVRRSAPSEPPGD